jgi:hypothetical protein
VVVAPRIKAEFFETYRAALTGALRPRAEVNAVALAFTPWLGHLVRGVWEGTIDLDRTGPGGAPATPWGLRLQLSGPSAAPVDPQALEDVEVLVTYAIA